MAKHWFGKAAKKVDVYCISVGKNAFFNWRAAHEDDVLLVWGAYEGDSLVASIACTKEVLEQLRQDLGATVHPTSADDIRIARETRGKEMERKGFTL